MAHVGFDQNIHTGDDTEIKVIDLKQDNKHYVSIAGGRVPWVQSWQSQWLC